MGPTQLSASSEAVRRINAEFLSPSIVAPSQVTPGGSPSTESWISPLKLSRRRARTLTGIVSPPRRKGVQRMASFLSLLIGGGGWGNATTPKSGAGLRTDNR